MVVFEDLNGDGYVTSEEDPEKGEVLERFMYYAFGMKWDGIWCPLEPLDPKEEHRYQYNGKEYSKFSGLSDYGFRYYLAEIGRFTGVDPLADSRSWVSPYNYVQNNPLSRIDPDGRLDDWYQNNKTKKVEWHSGSGEKEGYKNLGATISGTDQSGNTMYGAQDGKWYDSVPLNEVSISTKATYKESFAYAMVGELASGNKLGSDNPYLPYQGPDAVSFQVNVGASGIFSEGGFSAGVAMSSRELGVFGSTYGGAGISVPGVGISIQMNFHHRTTGVGNSLRNIEGISAGGSFGLGLIGGYSRSVDPKDGLITPSMGFHTYSLGAGVGGGLPLGARASVSATGYLPIIQP